MAEQRYQAVLAVISDGLSISQIASKVGVSGLPDVSRLLYIVKGGLTLYIRSESPGADKESNWLPSAPEAPFTLTFRTYGPGKDIIEQRWFPPAVLPAGK